MPAVGENAARLSNGVVPWVALRSVGARSSSSRKSPTFPASSSTICIAPEPGSTLPPSSARPSTSPSIRPCRRRWSICAWAPTIPPTCAVGSTTWACPSCCTRATTRPRRAGAGRVSRIGAIRKVGRRSPGSADASPIGREGNADMPTPLLMRLLGALALVVLPLAAGAQDYPNRTIKLVVPFPAGGPADTFGRILGDKMGALLGQTVVIENRSGAGGLTGTASVAKAEPDGYTVGIAASSALAINVNLRESMPFQPLRDFRLLTQIVSVPEILVVGTQVPAASLAELVALAKAQPGKLAFASTGHGGMPHLATELLKITAGIELVHVAYTGAAP